MERDFWVFGEPGIDVGHGRGGQIVGDDVDLSVVISGGHLVHKRQEFLRAVLVETVTQHLTGSCVQGREQGRGPIPYIVMSAFRGPVNIGGPWWLGAVQGLDLWFLVDRQDDGIRRRVQVETNDIDHFLLEVGVGRELERTLAMWLKAIFTPQVSHKIMGDRYLLLTFKVARHRLLDQ